MALLDCSAMGLEPDGRRAHLIPFGQTCQLIVDYKGLVELVMRSGHVDYIDAFVVHKNDKFRMVYGSHPSIEHEPALSDCGDMIGAYAVAHIKDTKMPKFTWMNKVEVDAVRGRSRASGSGPWNTDYEEMAKKTVIRRLSKTLPQSAELADALDTDLKHDGADDIPAGRFAAAKPVKITEPEKLQIPPFEVEPAKSPQSEEKEKTPAAEEVPPTPPKEVEQKKPAASSEAKAPPVENPAPKAPPQQEPAKVPAPSTPAPATTTPPAPAAGALPPSSPEDIGNLAAKCVERSITEKELCLYANQVYKSPLKETIKDLFDVSARRVTLMLYQFDGAEGVAEKIIKRRK